MFAALDEDEVRRRNLPANVVGVPIKMDLVGTLELALRLQPDTRRVFVVAGSSSFDARWGAAAQQQFRPYENRLELVYLFGLSMDDLVKRVANLPSHSIVQPPISSPTASSFLGSTYAVSTPTIGIISREPKPRGAIASPAASDE